MYHNQKNLYEANYVVRKYKNTVKKHIMLQNIGVFCRVYT